jgi:hypothetical protein
MHVIWLYVVIAITYIIGYARGAYVMKRCSEGDCPYFWCKNHKK